MRWEHGQHASPGNWPSAHSVPPGRPKRGQTCLPRQMIDHLDSPTVRLGRCGAGWRRPVGDAAAEAAPGQQWPQSSTEVHWHNQRSRASRQHSAQAATSPRQKRHRKARELGARALRVHPPLVGRGNQKKALDV